MTRRRIALVLFVAIMAAVISPTLDLLPTTLRASQHHSSTVTASTVVPVSPEAAVPVSIISRTTQRDACTARILSLDCVRLC